MDTRSFIVMCTEKARRMQRAGDFTNMSKRSIRLFGKTAEAIVSCTDKKKSHDVVQIDDELSADRFEGDAVTVADVFPSSENAVFDEGNIRFETEEGVFLSANQYEYIRKHGALSQYLYFAKTNNKDSTLKLTWKELYRRAGEARRDKAKEILYLCLGSVTWTREEATETKPAERVTSPLLLCPITEVPGSKDNPRFTISADHVKINTILLRELKRRNINIFVNVKNDAIPFGNAVCDVLSTIEENARYRADVSVNVSDFNVCILDSTNETICQLVENRINKLVQSPLIRVLAGEASYDDMTVTPIAQHAIYPLLADDSQREVIRRVLEGHCMNISAAAGTGKSQTMVNLAANLVIHGKRLCVMSEKAAANEVFLRYAGEIGLAQYCLVIDNKMTVPQLVNQIDHIRSLARVYVDPLRARDLLDATEEIEEELAAYDTAMYDVIPEIDMSLYELVGQAIAAPTCENRMGLAAVSRNYRTACRRLDDFSKLLDSTVSSAEAQEFFDTGTTGDEESDELLSEAIESLQKCGVDVIALAKDNALAPDRVPASAKATLAEMIAVELIERRGVAKCGNANLRIKYSRLTECYAKLKSLYANFMRQEVSARVARAVEEDRELIPLLERIKTSKMSVLDFFKKYGASVLKLCPIIVTTPSAAVNYITEEMNVFDTLLIDEASQVPIISVLPFLDENRQLIAFGDNMQLDLTSFFRSEDDDYYNDEGEFDMARTDKSILHLVQGKLPSSRLLYHYRSKTQHLVTVSNLLCYNGMLNVVPDVYTDWDKLPPALGFELRRVDVPFDPAAAAASAVKKKRKNKTATEYPYIEEHVRRVADTMAREIAEYVSALWETSPDKSVGIVTLNDAFQDRVLDALEEKDLSDADEEMLWVRSLENAQGKEADVVIEAIEHDRRNHRGLLLKNISGFFNAGELNEQSGNNRLNVLFTRAREKNVIFLAFDYKEIRDTSRSLYRLYTYLEYAATGNMSRSAVESDAVDLPNEYAGRLISEALGTPLVRTKIGDGTMAVDIGVMDDEAERYRCGFLMPSCKLTANALNTKINLLERAGWRVRPISPVYLLEKPESLKKQLPRMISSDNLLGSRVEENYLVSVKPALPVTLEEIAMRGAMGELLEEAPEVPEVITPLSVEELAREDLEGICRGACDPEWSSVSLEEIEAAYKRSSQAFLIKLARAASRFAAVGDLERLGRLSAKVYTLYSNMGERRACYLLAQLFRTLPDATESEGNQTFIRGLLEEARSMYIVDGGTLR